MSFLDDLRGASFRGVPFHVERSGFSGGRRLATFQFPQRDKPFNEDMGRSARQYDVTGFVVGSDWLAQANTLTSALEESGAATLVHPWLGSLRVRVSAFSVGFENTEAGVVRFSIKFIEDNEQTSPSSSRVSNVYTQESISVAETASINDFSQSFQVEGYPDFVGDSALEGVDRVCSLIGIQRPEMDFSDPESTGKTLSGLINTAYDLKELDNEQAPVFKTVARLQEFKNLNAINDLARRKGTIETVKAYLDQGFVVYEDAQGAIKDIETQTDTEILSTANTEIVRSFNAMRINAVKEIKEISVDATHLVEKSYNGTRSALVEAYDNYEDANRSSEIAERNKVEHPGFLSGNMRILSS